MELCVISARLHLQSSVSRFISMRLASVAKYHGSELYVNEDHYDGIGG